MSDAPFPIFILGVARSGTTLVQRLLNSLEGVAIAGEHFGFLRSVSIAHFEAIRNNWLIRRTPAQVRESLADSTSSPGHVNWFDAEQLERATRTFIESLYRDPERESHWGFKEVHFADDDRMIDLLCTLYPDARFVFIFRHPVDVLASQRIVFHYARQYSFGTMARMWAKDTALLLDQRKRYPNHTFLIRYEDLVAPRSPALEELIAWLGFTCTERQRAIVAQPEGRETRLGMDARPSAELLGAEQTQQVLRITEAVRGQLGYGAPVEQERSTPASPRRADPLPAPPAWEALRDDTTFAAGALPSRLTAGLGEQIARLPGWFTIDDCGHFALLLSMQNALGIRGDLLEIGPYHGRSSCVLAYHLAPHEKLVLSDVFDTTASIHLDPPTVDVLRSNLFRICPSLIPEQVEIHVGLSEDLALPPERRFRFCHLNGEHIRSAMLSDLELAASHLLPGGIIAVDGHQHSAFPGVTEALERFLAARPDFFVMADLNRHGAIGRKVYLCRRRDA